MDTDRKGKLPMDIALQSFNAASQNIQEVEDPPVKGRAPVEHGRWSPRGMHCHLLLFVREKLKGFTPTLIG